MVLALNSEDLFGVDGEDTGPKWVQVTREGNFPGYMGGLRPFAFTRADLDAMVSNIKNHPSYKVENGVATGRVIPWDFNHASEADPTTGQLPASGAPSHGWTLDMEVRNGADGKAELWALTEFLEPARTYVKGGQYRWASVAVAFNAVHPETGQNVGAIVTSIALTNTPFVEGMAELVASKKAASTVQTNVEAVRTWWEAARDASEAIGMMRELFSLPETAGAEEIMLHVGVVRGWLESGAAPIGTDPEGIIGAMRLILNLPSLTAQMEVLDEASKSIQALLEEQAAAAGMPAAPTTTGDGTVPEPQEDDMEMLQTLATALGVRANEKSVTDEVTALVELRNGLVEVLGLTRDGTGVIIKAAKDGADAKTKLAGILEAIGVEDVDGAIAKVSSTIEQAKKLTEVMPELDSLKADKEKAEEAAAEADVDAAIAACKLHPEMKGALLLQRKQDPEGFAKSFPKEKISAGKSHLLQPAVITASNGKTVPAAGAPTPSGGDIINLGAFPGRNKVARAKAYLSATRQDWDKKSNEDQFLAAVNLTKLPNVVDEVPA